MNSPEEDPNHFHDLVAKTLNALPEPFAKLVAEVRFFIRDWPPQDVLDDLGMTDRYELTGLYEGVPLTERTFGEPDPPSSVTLYRYPILDELESRGNVSLSELVQHVVIHELAHHFGWSDDDIAKIDKWWE